MVSIRRILLASQPLDTEMFHSENGIVSDFIDKHRDHAGEQRLLRFPNILRKPLQNDLFKVTKGPSPISTLGHVYDPRCGSSGMFV